MFTVYSLEISTNIFNLIFGFPSQSFTEGGGSNVFPGVLKVELPLLVPELVVVDSLQLGVAESDKELLGVVS